jgi:hypothetical protein
MSWSCQRSLARQESSSVETSESVRIIYGTRATVSLSIAAPRLGRATRSIQRRLTVYEDRVRTWFLDWAANLVHTDLIDDGISPGDYVALSVALAYVEGVEQYRRGGEPRQGQNRDWFLASAKRIFPSACEKAIKMLWKSTRCGLFHSGFTQNRVYVSHENYSEALEKTADGELHINPARFVQLVVEHFEAYVRELRTNPSGKAAKRFINLWDKRWENS